MWSFRISQVTASDESIEKTISINTIDEVLVINDLKIVLINIRDKIYMYLPVTK